jgi:hypothetical protein
VLLTLIIESQSSDPFQSVRNTGDFVSIPASWQTTPISAAITGWVSRPSAAKKARPNHCYGMKSQFTGRKPFNVFCTNIAGLLSKNSRHTLLN